MASQSFRRDVVLFLVALILPTTVLVVLGFRMIDQERTLAETRATGELQRAVGKIRQHLLGHLEQIKLEELEALDPGVERSGGHAYLYPEVELIARVEDGRVVLPWDGERRGAVVRRLLGAGSFAGWLQQGARAEYRRRDYRTAIEAYRRALELAEHPTQAGYARLSLARTFASAEQEDEAWAQYRQLLALPPDIADEHGIPMALYAARRLLDSGHDERLVFDRLHAEIDTSAWMPPAAAYMRCDLLDLLVATASDSLIREGAGDLREAVARWIPGSELLLALQREYTTLGLQYARPLRDSLEPRWVPFGQGAWLVSAGSLREERSGVVLAVNASAMFTQLEDSVWPAGQRGRVGVRAADEENGVLLGASLPGLEAVFPSRTDVEGGRALQRWFYGLALFLVLSITFFGAVLVWRDVRRELRLAGLRSLFVSSVSHELKTPLTSIRMFAEILQTKDPPDPKLQTDYLGTIVGESERLTRLLNNVLDLSKIEQDQMTYRPRPTSLTEVVHRAVQAMEYPLKQEGFTVNIEAPNEVPPVSVDPDALEQALLNLLSNAIKYSGDNREIGLRLSAEDGQGIIEVSDRGPGIAAQELERLTQKFYRVPTPENRSVPGTGLGLTLIDHMVRAHGGELQISSVVGEGSTFAIRLPVEGEK